MASLPAPLAVNGIVTFEFRPLNQDDVLVLRYLDIVMFARKGDGHSFSDHRES